MEDIYFDVFVLIVEKLDNKSIWNLSNTCKNFKKYAKLLSQKRPDLFTLFYIDKNIMYNMGIYDHSYYTGYVKITYLNPITEIKWQLKLEDETALETFSDKRFYSDQSWLLRYRLQSGIKKVLNREEFIFSDDYARFYKILTTCEAYHLQKEILY